MFLSKAAKLSLEFRPLYKGSTGALLVICIFLSNDFAFGQIGDQKTACEIEIAKTLYEFQDWIRSGGLEQLDLSNTSLSQDPDVLRNKVLSEFNIAEIGCVGPGEYGFPIRIGTKEKVCRFIKKDQLHLFLCDQQQLVRLNHDNPAEARVLFAHEIFGLAGIESPHGDSSDYRISSQIRAFVNPLSGHLDLKKHNDFPNLNACFQMNDRLGELRTEFKGLSMVCEANPNLKVPNSPFASKSLEIMKAFEDVRKQCFRLCSDIPLVYRSCEIALSLKGECL